MSSVQRSYIRKQLVSAKYTDCDTTVNEIINTITNYQNLKYKLEQCKVPQVGRRTLMVLRGTIPVPYRSNTYNIPIYMWIPHNYPQSAPLCYVDPTNDMTIRVSKSVDSTGRIYLPYLSDWVPNHSDLLGIIQVMIITFSEAMPLYAKSKGAHSQQAAQHQPPEAPTSSAALSSSSSGTGNPPYPTSFNSHPAYPGLNNYPAVNPVMSTPYPPQPLHPQAPGVPGPVGGPVSQPNLPFSSYGYTPPTWSTNQQQQQQAASSRSGVTGHSQSNFDTIQPKHFRDSLETAVADEIRKNVKEIEETANAEIQVLRKTSEDLNAGRKKLDNLMKEIDTKLVELSETKDKIREKDRLIEVQLSRMDTSNDTPNIDECFGPVQPLYKQLINCFVEENAIVDTIYHLNHALQRGVIDINVFIKHVKELSRRQFMLRALIKQCREKARLPA